MTRFLQASIAALLVSAAAAQAWPEMTYTAKSTTVSYRADTDPAIVLARIEAAAQHLCGSHVESGSYYTQNEAKVLNKGYDACVAGAVARAVSATNSPAIADIYAKKASAEQIAGN